MIKIGLNGFGRIGRAIFRRSLHQDNIEIAVVNEINPDKGNIAYTLNYDTIYGQLDSKFQVDGNFLSNSNTSFAVTNKDKISEVNWHDYDVDYVIDASGIIANVIDSSNIISSKKAKKVFVTHSPNSGTDFEMVLGCNHLDLDVDNHNVIATSICDATALAPALELIDKKIGIKSAQITTLHPWLNYQNLMDGSSSSWSVPGEIYHHFALGRSAIGNLIPKPTSAVSATCKVLSNLDETKIGSFSYRTPTAIIGSADLSINLKAKISEDELNSIFNDFVNEQKWDIFEITKDPLVSLDYVGSKFSAVVDQRWTKIIDNDLLKLVLWYDNESGYAMRVLDQVLYVHEKLK